MTHNLRLLYGFGKWDIGRHTLADNDPIEIAVQRNDKDGGELYAKITSGQMQTTLKFTGDTLVIPNEYITTGKLQIIIESRVDGETVNLYTVDELLITALDHEYQVIPEITALQERMDALERRADGYDLISTNI